VGIRPAIGCPDTAGPPESAEFDDQDLTPPESYKVDALDAVGELRRVGRFTERLAQTPPVSALDPALL
jgi:hypothetical protein